VNSLSAFWLAIQEHTTQKVGHLAVSLPSWQWKQHQTYKESIFINLNRTS